MTSLSYDKLKKRRKKVIAYLQEKYGKHITVLNTDFPKKAQRKIARNLCYRTVFLIHRQYGKTEFIFKVFNHFLTNPKFEKPPFGQLYATSIKQVRKLYLTRFQDNLELLRPTYDREDSMLKVKRPAPLTGKFRVFFGGMDLKPDKERGGTADIIGCDEFGDWPEDEFEKVVAPQAIVKGANVMITGTPKGPNHFMKKFLFAEKKMNSGDKDYFALKWTIDDSLKAGEITKQEYDRTREEYSGPLQYIWDSEYMLDWYAYHPGKIFGLETQNVKKDGRIGYFPLEPRNTVDTFWDLGRNGTAVWFRQRMSGKHYYIYYVDDVVEVHLQEFIKKKVLPVIMKNNMKIRYNVLPHDAGFGELMSPEPRIKVLQGLLPGKCTVLPPFKKPQDLIDAARRTFERCYFDEDGCEKGFERLQMYKMKGDKPDKKDPSSHGADAFLLAENFKDFYGDSEKSALHDHLGRPIVKGNLSVMGGRNARASNWWRG